MHHVLRIIAIVLLVLLAWGALSVPLALMVGAYIRRYPPR